MSSTKGNAVQQSEATADSARKMDIGLVAALSIGVGGMIGAGIFSILGVVARISGSAMPLSFAIGGVVAGLAAYSYVALGKTFPSERIYRPLGEGQLPKIAWPTVLPEPIPTAMRSLAVANRTPFRTPTGFERTGAPERIGSGCLVLAGPAWLFA
jgi:hypothetical protein